MVFLIVNSDKRTSWVSADYLSVMVIVIYGISISPSAVQPANDYFAKAINASIKIDGCSVISDDNQYPDDRQKRRDPAGTLYGSEIILLFNHIRQMS